MVLFYEELPESKKVTTILVWLGLGTLLGCGDVSGKTRVLPCWDMEDKMVKLMPSVGSCIQPS